jgi:L-ribulokinase
MYGAVAAGAAAGGYDSIADAAAAMVRPHVRTYRPDRGATAVYDELFRDYTTLHDHFGRGENDVMRRLRALRARQVREAPASVGGFPSG